MEQAATAIKKSPLVSKAEEIIKKSEHLMTPAELAQHGKLILRFERAKTLRQATYKYYDGMHYEQDYASNEDLKNTYLTPKANATEVRVNTGTSEKKLDAIKNELLTMNIKQEIKAFDKNDLKIQELGDDMSDIVDRTNLMEKDEDMMEEATDELLTQRVVYVRETYQPRSVLNRQETISIARKELLSGLKVFPGSWTIPAYLWDTQPYVFTYDKVSYEEAEALFGHLPNFKHVKPSRAEQALYLGGAFAHTFGELQDGEVEIVTYYSLPDNEYQVKVATVPMYDVGEPLPCSAPRYPIRAFTVKSMARNFLGGRPVTAMAKTVQALSNEMLRLFIRKTQQSLEPPMATPKGGKIYSKNIFDPAAWTQGLRKGDFEKLIDHEGVTQGEMSMYKIVDEEVEKFIGTPNIAQGLQGSREMSATEVVTLTKQFLKQLGYTVAALMRMKRDLTEMRIYTVMENYLDATDKKLNPLTNKVEEVYRSFTVENAKFSNNRKGRKIIKILDRDLTTDEQVKLHRYEEDQAAKGNHVRIKFLNRQKLRNIPIFWYVSTSIQDKEGTALDKLTFQDQLNQASIVAEMTGKQPNPDIVTEEFERKWKAKDWFSAPPPELGPDGMPVMPGMDQDQVKADSQKLLEEIDGEEGASATGRPPMASGEGSMGAQMNRGMRSSVKSAAQSVAAKEVATA